MKPKLALILSLICAALLLSACTEASPEPSRSPIETPQSQTVSAGKGFSVSLLTSGSDTKYEYTITANDGSVIESATCLRQPGIKPISDSLIGIRFYDDTGVRTWFRYYDLEKGIASRSFFNAFWDNGSIVAYNDYELSGKLVLQDIFDEDGYYSELEIESDAMELIVTAAVPSKDEKSLSVEYRLGPSAKPVIVELPLTEAQG